MSAERDRLERGPRGPVAVAPLGPVRLRAGLGNGARGLQRRRQRLGLLPPRPCSLARLPLERGRAGRDLRRASTAVLRAGLLERPRRHPQGAGVRAVGPAGQPRGGRQGVLVVSGQHAHALLDALALHVPAGGVPLRTPPGGEPAPRQGRTRVRTARHGHLRRRTLLGDHRRVRQGAPGGHPDPRHGRAMRAPTTATLHLLPTLWFRNTWSWEADTPRPQIDARRRGPYRGARPAGPCALVTSGEPDATVLRQRDQRGAAVRRRRGARRTPRTGSTIT